MEYTDNIQQIHDYLKLKKYRMESFWYVCPFNLEALLKDRKPLKIDYLHVGMVWARLSGMSSDKTGKYFKRDHSSVLYAEKKILEVLENKRFGRPSKLKILNLCKEAEYKILPSNDIWQDYLASMVLLESKIQLEQIK
jgi:hypothetical protein